MSNLRKINKILGITLIVFSLGVFANYSKTSSKYFVDDTDLKTDNIVNLINFKSLKYGETKGIISASEKLTDLVITDIDYTLQFYRKVVSDKDTDVKTDLYKVVVDAGCTITDVKTPNAPKYTPNADGSLNESSKGAMWTLAKEDNSQTDNIANLLYVNDTKSNTSKGTAASNMITVNYTCPLDVVLRKKATGGEEISTEFGIYEKINEESEFVYLEYNDVRDFVQKVYNVLINGDRKEKMHIPVNDSLLNIDEEFDKWVDVFASKFAETNIKYQNMKTILTDYINKNDIKNKTNQGLGLNFGNSDAGASYKSMYSFDTIASQAVSYNVNVASTNKPDLPSLYFIDPMSTSEADALFERYLKTYYPKYTASERTTILQYVKDSGGISSVLGDSTKNIPGIGHISVGPIDYINVDPSILRIIENRSRVIVAKGQDRILNSFTDNLKVLNETYNWISSSDWLMTQIIIGSSKNIEESLNTTNTNMNDYYFLKSGNAIIAIRIYNNADDLDNTYAEIYRFKMDAANPSNETITIDNPTRLMYIGNLRSSAALDKEKSYVDYASTVIAQKTGDDPLLYANVVADAKEYVSSGTNNSSVVEFSQLQLLRINYIKNPKLVPMDRTMFAASTASTDNPSEVADSEN